MNKNSHPEIGGRSAKIALILLVIVYVFNFIDRQILSVLAEDIKADLNITDSDLGFLFGTAFAVFYAIFGLPLGKLADVWSRKKIISLGLATWSIMTALSGTARSFFSLSVFRVGVGIGESSASPASYSLLSDYFPPKVRTTILAIYSSGVYIGAGIGLFLGGWILELWNNAYTDPSLAPFGMRGWQAAFMGVGIPGIILALFTWQIKEPKRGMSDGIETPEHPHPFKEMLNEFVGITPLALLQYKKLLGINFLIALMIVIAGYFLILLTGDMVQWIAFGLGCYVVTCWIQSLKIRDYATYSMIFKSKALLFSVIGFPFLSFITYSGSAFGPAFYMRNFGVSEGEVATVLGLTAAIAGMIGVILGGVVGDKLRQKYANGRLYIGFVIILFAVPCNIGVLYSEKLYASYIWNFIFQLISPMWVGIAPALVADLVMPRMRAIAGAFYILMVSMLGLALGPYSVGLLSDTLISQGYSDAESLKTALAASLGVLIISAAMLLLACRYLPGDESTKLERAKALGEEF